MALATSACGRDGSTCLLPRSSRACSHGAVWVFLLAADGTAALTRRLAEPAAALGAGARWGHALAGVGDVDANGECARALRWLRSLCFDMSRAGWPDLAATVKLASGTSVQLLRLTASLAARESNLELAADAVTARDLGAALAAVTDLDGDGLAGER
jgi:hypothetical protein